MTDPLSIYMSGIAVHGNTPFDAPYISHIEGNLYQGGCTTGLVLPTIIKHVVSLYPWERYSVSELAHADGSYTEVKMYDSSDEVDYYNVLNLALFVRDKLLDGPTLVHCQAGLNRSGLIAGAALILMGSSPEQAIKQLRAKRSPAVLCNQTFERFLLDFRPRVDQTELAYTDESTYESVPLITLRPKNLILPARSDELFDDF